MLLVRLTFYGDGTCSCGEGVDKCIPKFIVINLWEGATWKSKKEIVELQKDVRVYFESWL